jgi:hypothetical protein
MGPASPYHFSVRRADAAPARNHRAGDKTLIKKRDPYWNVLVRMEDCSFSNKFRAHPSELSVTRKTRIRDVSGSRPN